MHPNQSNEQQMVDVYGEPCDVHSVRTFRDGCQLGAGYAIRRPSSWFVYDCEAGATGNGVWHMHCGPYLTFEDARDWILGIREGGRIPRPYQPLACVRGHRTKTTGCVSCELLYQHSSLAGDGNQLPSGLRGDPGAPRGQTDDTRDKSYSESSPAGEAMQVANISGASHLSDRAEAAEQQVKEP